MRRKTKAHYVCFLSKLLRSTRPRASHEGRTRRRHRGRGRSRRSCSASAPEQGAGSEVLGDADVVLDTVRVAPANALLPLDASTSSWANTTAVCLLPAHTHTKGPGIAGYARNKAAGQEQCAQQHCSAVSCSVACAPFLFHAGPNPQRKLANTPPEDPQTRK